MLSPAILLTLAGCADLNSTGTEIKTPEPQAAPRADGVAGSQDVPGVSIEHIAIDGPDVILRSVRCNASRCAALASRLTDKDITLAVATLPGKLPCRSALTRNAAEWSRDYGSKKREVFWDMDHMTCMPRLADISDVPLSLDAHIAREIRRLRALPPSRSDPPDYDLVFVDQRIISLDPIAANADLLVRDASLATAAPTRTFVRLITSYCTDAPDGRLRYSDGSVEPYEIDVERFRVVCETLDPALRARATDLVSTTWKKLQVP